MVVNAFVHGIERGRICCSIRECGEGAQLSEKQAKMAHSAYVYATYHDVRHPAAKDAPCDPTVAMPLLLLYPRTRQEQSRRMSDGNLVCMTSVNTVGATILKWLLSPSRNMKASRHKSAK